MDHSDIASRALTRKHTNKIDLQVRSIDSITYIIHIATPVLLILHNAYYFLVLVQYTGKYWYRTQYQVYLIHKHFL